MCSIGPGRPSPGTARSPGSGDAAESRRGSILSEDLAGHVGVRFVALRGWRRQEAGGPPALATTLDPARAAPLQTKATDGSAGPWLAERALCPILYGRRPPVVGPVRPRHRRLAPGAAHGLAR